MINITRISKKLLTFSGTSRYRFDSSAKQLLQNIFKKFQVTLSEIPVNQAVDKEGNAAANR